MEKPLISIIIPTYNRAHLIGEALDSFIAQTYSNWECIVVDDGSTDDTKNIMAKYIYRDSRFQYHCRPSCKPKGANSCRNYGFEQSKGEFVNWFDSDDVMKPNFLEEKVKAFKGNVDAVIHRNNYGNYQFTQFRDSKFNYDNGKSLFYNYAMETIEIQTCGFMWKKSFLEGKSLFDETVMRYQDNEFHIRMLAFKNLKVKIIDVVLATIRSGDGNDSQISSKTNLTKQKLFDIFYYRYKCLKLAKDNTISVDADFHKVIAKKTLWAFYAGLRFETRLINRFKDFIKNYKKLQYVYSSPQIFMLDVVKSQFYILKIIILR